MARKTKDITIDKPGRDFGREFQLTELPAWDAFIVASKLAHALTVSGINLPDMAKTPEGIAEVGLTMLLYIKPEVGHPILEQLKDCVKAYPPKRKSGTGAFELAQANQPQEPATWLTLLTALYHLHLGFSKAADSPNSA